MFGISGTKASIAARSAVHGSLEYLNQALFCPSINNEMTTTKDVFIALLRSFHAAHSLILQEQGMLTTLTVCTVLPLPSSNTDTNIYNKKYIACTCNVGDSLAYVYSRYNILYHLVNFKLQQSQPSLYNNRINAKIKQKNWCERNNTWIS